MKKMLVFVLACMALMSSGVLADPLNTTVNVRFWTDLNMTQPFIDNFLWVYARSSCPQYEPPLCQFTYYHSQYTGGIATFNVGQSDNYTIYVLKGSVSFNCETCSPSVFKYSLWQPIDSLSIGQNDTYNLNYYWNTTLSGSSPWFGEWDWNFWLSVAGILILIVAACLLAYFTQDSNASWIVVIVGVILVYVLLKWFGILTGALFFGLF